MGGRYSRGLIAMTSPAWPYITPGIPDELFERVEGIPMTKEEVRALVISKLRLREDSRVLDVGSGTGSVAVEAALIARRGLVYAIDRDERAIELTRRNAMRFGVGDRVVVIHGEAPEALDKVPNEVDAVFIGGSGGKLRDIITGVCGKLAVGGRLVIDAITLENASLALTIMAELGFVNVEVTEVVIAKGFRTSLGTAMLSRNPIFIIVGERDECRPTHSMASIKDAIKRW
ncbi:precorrin-6Y C5,15-methyltransferase (decarboxylating) subunit CbiT [Vulcanisaeta distributa]|uniref:precorrin-6Y C5,15-methyltransferase (decarboxylating) subunit CbiT n=1 Tax=Vulcanisaeta distributa TaxID=164451 RepID=UPI001FB1B780|nr:precorrin-6Y C5,15-methyltransferase (decarboxylating) subunit CbiT [Vulcanisaeta distributa]